MLTLTYHSTHIYVLDINRGKLLVDCGWPDSYNEFSATAKRAGLNPVEIRYLFVTHFHMDHAGLVQDLKNQGATLILMESQVDAIQPLNDYLRMKKIGFRDIQTKDNFILPFAKSRAYLARLNLDGEIIPTPGHSPDHASLILDDGSAFTGDLPPPSLVTEEQEELNASWKRVMERPVTRIYPAHGKSYIPKAMENQ
jgi:glyoxylase-like metal-dependent hydrolase (beta-lactamase superfamily II)